eukprot:CAMPEP_0194419578 /NCGR_PEP_ID=MMETSP0176-20130528/18735_1 /TAXON_ID=216777 /ORGANISM="Proboscia alata, Strain PI-D3" /LENGTH=827 /DNA_ID=CAMNT_0039226629 /DNA_START=157 /DNA_END=2640 /DNA_ORIENTATION=+
MSLLNLESKRLEAEDLLTKLTITQKVRLLSGGSLWTTKEVPHLNLPKIWLCDGPHGLRKVDEWSTDLTSGRIRSTCFPTASCMACSWDPTLLKKVGNALGVESRFHGVTVLLGPGINLIRHPCGGRTFEYFSEDPYLTGCLASALVQGIQSQNVGVALKHFFCNNQEKWRFDLNVVVDERTQKELYERAFKHVVRESQPLTIMCAYNKVNGIFCCENKPVLTRIRKEWNFKGLFITDWGATNDRVLGIQAGIDLEMPGSVGACDDHVLNALKNGELREEELDKCVTRVLCLKLLGKEFNNLNRREVINGSLKVDIDEHHLLAKKVAMGSAVLLKNDNNILPLSRDTSIAVIGEFARKPRFQGMGSSDVFPTKVDSAWERIRDYTEFARYVAGYDNTDPNETINHELIEEAVQLAKISDVALIFCGLTETSESEAFDRTDINLSAGHNALVEAVSAANKNTVVMLTNGSPVSMPWLDQVSGILDCWLGGQAGASAAIDLVFGESSPSGKLAQTFPCQFEDVPSKKCFPGVNKQVVYQEGLNVGYRYYDSAKLNVLFPFGHGLSYSTFELQNFSAILVASSEQGVEVSLSLEIKNVGDVFAGEVVQCYVHSSASAVYRPEQELKAFQKVFLKPNEKVNVTMTLRTEAFSLWDVGTQDWIIEGGDYEIRMGTSCRNIHFSKTISISSNQTCSAEAIKLHPPLQHRQLEEEMNSMCEPSSCLNNSIDGSRLHKNSLLCEAQKTCLGRALRKTALWTMNRNADEVTKKCNEEMVDGVSFRAIVLLSRGYISYPILELILHIMNGEFFSFLRKLFPTISSYLYQNIFYRKNQV